MCQLEQKKQSVKKSRQHWKLSMNVLEQFFCPSFLEKGKKCIPAEIFKMYAEGQSANKKIETENILSVGHTTRQASRGNAKL